MSKGNMFLGLARGSVGDLTFYRRNAQQITRVRVRNVKNPQSPAQMGQRAIQRTAVQAYTVLKSICDHSFQGVSYGANSYSKFLSINMDMLRQSAAAANSNQKAYCPSGFQGITAMPWIISKGTLPMVEVSLKEDQDNTNIVGLFPYSGNPSNLKYSDVIDMLNAQQGDQVTIIAIPNPTNHGFPDEPLGRNIQVARFILDPNDGDLTSPFFKTEQDRLVINKANIRNEGSMFWNSASGWLGVYPAKEAEGDVIGVAAILSRQNEDGSWLRSDSILVYNLSWNDNGYTLKQASTLSPTEIYIENDYYLNNAE